MRWQEKLAKRADDRNLALISKRLGFSKNRLYLVIREGQCPNAIDAVKICGYFGASVEEIFGEDAANELKLVPAATVEAADRAAEKALEMTTRELRQVIDAAKKTRPPASPRARGKSRKSG